MSLPDLEAFRCRTRVRGSATPVPIKIRMPGLVRSGTTSGERMRFFQEDLARETVSRL